MKWMIVGLLSVASVALPERVMGQTFDKVETRTAYALADEGDKGKLAVEAESIRFLKKNERDEYFSIPTESVNEVFYSRVAGRRIGAAILVSPLLLFSKGKKHYMTLSFNDGDQIVGAVEFKLDKKNYRGVLRSVEQVTGLVVKFDQEGVKAEEEGFAERDQKPSGDKEQVIEIAPTDVATVSIETDPEGAEIEIDGAFAGMTPRTKELSPGEYDLKILLKGYRTWERKITVEAGEEFPVRVQLEQE